MLTLSVNHLDFNTTGPLSDPDTMRLVWPGGGTLVAKSYIAATETLMVGEDDADYAQWQMGRASAYPEFGNSHGIVVTHIGRLDGSRFLWHTSGFPGWMAWIPRQPGIPAPPWVLTFQHRPGENSTAMTELVGYADAAKTVLGVLRDAKAGLDDDARQMLLAFLPTDVKVEWAPGAMEAL